MSDTGNGRWLRGLFRRKEEDLAADAPEPLFPPLFPAATPADPQPPSLAVPPPPSRGEPPAFAQAPFARGPSASPPQSPPASAAISPSATDAAFTCYLARTLANQTLTLPDGAAELAVSLDSDAAFSAFIVIAAAQPHVCLILAQDGRHFRIEGDSLAGAAISARVMRSTQRDIVRLKQPMGGMRFLQSAEGALAAPVRFDGSGTSAEAAWSLAQADVADMSLATRALAVEFASAVNGGLRHDQLVERLAQRTLRPDLAEAVLRLLPRDELEDLARRALNEAPLRAVLQAALPASRCIAAALPALAEWRITRGPLSANGQSTSPAADAVELASCVNASGASLGQPLLSLARTQVTPRKTLAVLAAIRNDGPYLLEWLAYHLAVGVEHIFLYSGLNEDGSDELSALLARHGVITHIRNTPGPGLNIREKAYAHALTLLPQTLDYRWMAVIDVDDYLGFDTQMFASLADFIGLHEAQPVDAVALCHLLHGAMPADPYTPGLALEQFPFRVRAVSPQVKSLFRTRQFCASQGNFPYPVYEAPFIFRGQDGSFHHHPGVTDRLAAYADRPGARQAWVASIAFRSAAEALWKAEGVAAGQPNQEAARQAYLDQVTRAFIDPAWAGALTEDVRTRACANGQVRMLEKLLGLPGVAQAQERISERFESRLASLAETELQFALPEHASAAERHFRDVLVRSQGAIQQTIFPTLTPMV